ncbi:pectin lyase-like protein [Neocallimastix sp. 'constans']
MKTILSIILLQIVNVLSQNCNPPFYQCGGEGWKGSNCCVEGYECKKINNWYSECVEIENNVSNAVVYHNSVNNSEINENTKQIMKYSDTSSSVIGFASMNGGTTGGQGGQTITVSNQSELEVAVKGDNAKIVKINGIIKLSAEVSIGSNTSLIGANANSGLTGAGISIKNVKNVIVQNLKFNSCLGSSKDCINAQKSTNIWVDHCEFYNDRNNGKDYYDGLIDFTHACDYITVSWCFLHDHYKASLVGHSDSNGSEDTGKLHITYHHNYFKNIGSRLPSLRFGTGHVFNNVYENIDSSSVNVRMGAQALVESNIFKNAKRPISTDLSSKEEGLVVERNNDFGTTANTNSITKKGNLSTVPYQYSADNVKNIYNTVTSGAGVGNNNSSVNSEPVNEQVNEPVNEPSMNQSMNQ